MSSICNFLVLPGRVKDAVAFYRSVFSNNMTVTSPTDYDSSSHMTGNLMSATIKIHHQDFVLFGSGPEEKPSVAVSFMINCDGGQSQVDQLWDSLSSQGGEQLQCGWVKDQFGFYWQIVPKELAQLMGGKDQAVAQRVMQALRKMSKIEIAGLERAAKGEFE